MKLVIRQFRKKDGALCENRGSHALLEDALFTFFFVYLCEIRCGRSSRTAVQFGEFHENRTESRSFLMAVRGITATRVLGTILHFESTARPV